MRSARVHTAFQAAALSAGRPAPLAALARSAAGASGQPATAPATDASQLLRSAPPVRPWPPVAPPEPREVWHTPLVAGPGARRPLRVLVWQAGQMPIAGDNAAATAATGSLVPRGASSALSTRWWARSLLPPPDGSGVSLRRTASPASPGAPPRPLQQRRRQHPTTDRPPSPSVTPSPPPRPCRGVVVFLHGLHEHAARISPWVSAFLSAGFDVVAPDLEGHGATAQRPGASPVFRDVALLASDVLSVARFAAERAAAAAVGPAFSPAAAAAGSLRAAPGPASAPAGSATGSGCAGPPVILAGFSAGGFVALAAAAQQEAGAAAASSEAARGAPAVPSFVPDVRLAGVACLSPLLRVHADSHPGPAAVAAATALAAVAPGLPLAAASMGKAYAPQVLARELAEEVADPLVYTGWLRAGPGLALHKAMERVPETLAGVRRAGLPVLLLHGEADRVCDVRGSRDAADALATATRLRCRTFSGSSALVPGSDAPQGLFAAHPLSAFVEYEGGHHDLTRERSRISSQVASHLLAWCGAVADERA